MNKNRTWVFLGVAGGIICIGMAILYFSTPANDLPLPSFLGKENSSVHHFKHGIAALPGRPVVLRLRVVQDRP